MDIRPKRKKSKDNPYTLKSINNMYYVTFKDSNLKEQTIQIDKNIFNQMDKFELEDISQMHKYDRHIEHAEVFDETINKKAFNKPISTEEIVETIIINEELRQAINELPTIQKRRINKYYYKNKTLEEIAKEENCSKVAIKYSIDCGIEKIKKKLKNYT